MMTNETGVKQQSFSIPTPAFIYALIISIVCTRTSEGGIEDRTFEKQRLELAAKSEQILIENKACDSIQACRNKKLFFISPARHGLSIKIYAVSSKPALHQIISECAKYFVDSGGAIKIDIEIFSISKDEELRKFFWEKEAPNMTIEFEG